MSDAVPTVDDRIRTRYSVTDTLQLITETLQDASPPTPLYLSIDLLTRTLRQEVDALTYGLDKSLSEPCPALSD